MDSTVNLLTNNLVQCEYYSKFQVSGSHNPSGNFLCFIHINIRSLQKNFDSLQEFLCLQPNLPDVICLTETRLKQQSLLNVNLSGYSLIHHDSPTNAGRVAKYLSKQIQYEVLTEMHMGISGCENIWVKLIDFNVILANIYRHPKNNLQNFINATNCNLERMKCSKVFLMGDYNINLKFESSIYWLFISSSC